MNWLKYLTVIPAVVDLAKFIRDRRRGKRQVCDDEERVKRDLEKVINTGRDIARDRRRK